MLSYPQDFRFLKLTYHTPSLYIKSKSIGEGHVIQYINNRTGNFL
jgi:hypothetical protein